MTRKAIKFLIGFIAVLIIIQCESEKPALTKDFLKGNWCYFDSISASDDEYPSYIYSEIYLNDSIYIDCPVYLGIGPSFQSYAFEDDSIKFKTGQALFVEVIDSNRIRITFMGIEGDPLFQELERMKEHAYPLKEFYNRDELEMYWDYSEKRMLDALLQK